MTRPSASSTASCHPSRWAMRSPASSPASTYGHSVTTGRPRKRASHARSYAVALAKSTAPGPIGKREYHSALWPRPSASASSGSKRSAAASGASAGIELEEHEAPGRLQAADVQAPGGQALAVALALPRAARGGRPSRRGARPARRRRRGPPAARARCAGRPPCAGTIPRRPAAPPPRRSSRARNLEPDARAARRIEDLDGFTLSWSAPNTASACCAIRSPASLRCIAETDDYVAFGTEYRALAGLPGIEKAQVWEPKPATVYFWERH